MKKLNFAPKIMARKCREGSFFSGFLLRGMPNREKGFFIFLVFSH